MRRCDQSAIIAKLAITAAFALLTIISIPARGSDPAPSGATLYEEPAFSFTRAVAPGWVAWTVEPDEAAPSFRLVRAFAAIPDRGLKVLITWRRNSDPELAASHIIELLFDAPKDSRTGGVANAPGLLMKEQEADQGDPLVGIQKRVTDSYFVIGLPAKEPDMSRNVALLRDRSWIDALIVYENGRRAILRLAKGPDGQRAFAEAFASWSR